MSSMGRRLQTIVPAWFRYQLSGSSGWKAGAQRETQFDALQLSHSGRLGQALAIVDSSFQRMWWHKARVFKFRLPKITDCAFFVSAAVSFKKSCSTQSMEVRLCARRPLENGNQICTDACCFSTPPSLSQFFLAHSSSLSCSTSDCQLATTSHCTLNSVSGTRWPLRSLHDALGNGRGGIVRVWADDIGLDPSVKLEPSPEDTCRFAQAEWSSLLGSNVCTEFAFRQSPMAMRWHALVIQSPSIVTLLLLDRNCQFDLSRQQAQTGSEMGSQVSIAIHRPLSENAEVRVLRVARRARERYLAQRPGHHFRSSAGRDLRSAGGGWCSACRSGASSTRS